jgi:hypothetical protein
MFSQRKKVNKHPVLKDLKAALPVLSFSVPEIKIDLPLIHGPLFSTADLYSNFLKIPRCKYKNPHPENENPKRAGRLPDDLWLQIYHFLEASSAVKLIIACKKLGEIANDDSMRQKLYVMKEHTQRKNAWREMKSSAPSPTQFAKYPFLSLQFNRAVFADHVSPDVYNKGPGGFTMKSSRGKK